MQQPTNWRNYCVKKVRLFVAGFLIFLRRSESACFSEKPPNWEGPWIQTHYPSENTPLQSTPYQSHVPLNSAIGTYVPAAYFYDSTSITVDDSGATALGFFLKALRETPTWVDMLMSARNRVVSLLGLKKLGKLSRLDPDKPASGCVVGERVGIFTVIMNSDSEVLLGDKDRHLDVTVSIHRSCGVGCAQATITVTTVIHVHNWFGRLYMLPVTPMHRIIGPAVLRAIGKPSSGMPKE